MILENLSLLPTDQLPQTDKPKAKKVSINKLQDNLIFLMNRDKVSLADIHKETMIPFPTIYGWYKGDVKTQLLGINVKELADYFDVSIETLAFADLKKEQDELNDKKLVG